jgi:hypothetical protein
VSIRPRQQPFHEPIGLSPATRSRRWILSLAATILILGGGIFGWLSLTERI